MTWFSKIKLLRLDVHTNQCEIKLWCRSDSQGLDVTSSLWTFSVCREIRSGMSGVFVVLMHQFSWWLYVKSKPQISDTTQGFPWKALESLCLIVFLMSYLIFVYGYDKTSKIFKGNHHTVLSKWDDHGRRLFSILGTISVLDWLCIVLGLYPTKRPIKEPF